MVRLSLVNDRVAQVKARMPLLGLFVLSLYGLCNEFLAATWWIWSGMALSALWAFRYRDWLRRICFGENGEPVETALAFLIGAALMWFIVVRTVGGGVTYLFGAPATLRPVVLHIYHSRAHSGGVLRACQDQWRGEVLDQWAQRYICVKDAHEVRSSGYASTHEGRQVEGELIGSRGPFGFYIRRLNILRDIQPYAGP